MDGAAAGGVITLAKGADEGEQKEGVAESALVNDGDSEHG
jgi:hypothetical protein